MSSNLSLLPYKYNVTYNSAITTIPAFPGAYIYNRGIDSSPTALPVPIYFSEPAIAATITFMADRDYMLLVLPGFKVEIYADVSFGTFKYSVDNTAGTDLKFFANKTDSYTMSSYKLYYGIQEITTGLTYYIDYGSASVSYSTYNNTAYTLYSYTTGGSFKYIGPATSISAELLVVAGGGAGGRSDVTEAAGGGGAGEVITFKIGSVLKNALISCNIGAGGDNSNGGNTSVVYLSGTKIEAQGGGKGANGDNTYTGGSDGGSGGGTCKAYHGYHSNRGFRIGLGRSYSLAFQSGLGFTTNFQSYVKNGGKATGAWGSAGGGGGGGGAGENGLSQVDTDDFRAEGNPGRGGNGIQWHINNTYYGGGGGGGAGLVYAGDGGLGGGGAGGADGTANTGGGGGGQARASGSAQGKGGSGIVIIAVKTADTVKLPI